MTAFTSILLGFALAGQAQGGTTGQRTAGPPGEDVSKVVREAASRMVLVEVTIPSADGKETAIASSPALVFGARQAMTIAPRLAANLSTRGAAIRIVSRDSSGVRRSEGRFVRTDTQTGISVFESEGIPLGAAEGGAPPETVPLEMGAVPEKNAPVLLVEPSVDSVPRFRLGRLMQARAYLDQGRGKNPLLVVQVLDPRDRPGDRSYSRWDDDLTSGAGSLLMDMRGGLIGIITPPVLGKGDRPAKAGPSAVLPKTAPPASPAPIQLKEGEVLALPSEVARTIAESLAQGKDPIRGYLGASFREVLDPPDMAVRLGSAPTGVRVEKVFPGGPADQGGLRAGDWLIAIAEKRAVTYADVIRFSELVEYGGQGRTVRLLVAREIPAGWGIVKLKIEIGWR